MSAQSWRTAGHRLPIKATLTLAEARPIVGDSEETNYLLQIAGLEYLARFLRCHSELRVPQARGFHVFLLLPRHDLMRSR